MGQKALFKSYGVDFEQVLKPKQVIKKIKSEKFLKKSEN